MCVHHRGQVQQQCVHLLFQWSRHVSYSPTELVLKKKSSCFVLAERDKRILGVCMLVRTAKCLVGSHICNGASLDLFCKMSSFLFMNQRTLEAFLLLHSSWFQQAHFRHSLTAEGFVGSTGVCLRSM